MPEPVYIAGAGEVVYYYNLSSGDYDGWGLHAWNNADCQSYADYDRPEGGTAWGSSLPFDGIDPNFGAYWVLNIIESPNCTNFIPYNFDAGIQTSDLSVDLSSPATNPTGNFYVLEGNESTVFPYPRTFEFISCTWWFNTSATNL